MSFIHLVFVCSSVLLDYMKEQKEKTEAMLKEFEHVKLNVEKLVEMCEYINTHTQYYYCSESYRLEQ